MDKPKGLKVVVEFGDIRVSIDNPEYDVDSMDIKDQSHIIKSTVKSAADQVIEIQKSFH